MNEKLMDIKILAELKLDIIKNGKIRRLENCPYNEIPCTHKDDEDRVKGLYSLMDKYTYGWYIVTETLEEQLASITRFELYILDKVINEEMKKYG